MQEEAKEWEEEKNRLQALLPVEVTRDTLKATEIPALEEQHKKLEAKLPGVQSTKDIVRISSSIQYCYAY